MAIFEVSPQKILKKIKKFATDGSVSKVPITVREERSKLLEDSGVATDLISFLLDIGHPDLAADVAEEVMRRHRHISTQVRGMIVDRLHEFSRSTELLRVAWQSFLERHDFRGALEVLSSVDKISETRLIEMTEDRMKSSLRFDGSIHPDADQSVLISWSLCLCRKDRPDDAIDFLWKVCRGVEFPHKSISLLAFWIGDRNDGLDTQQWIALMGIAATANQMDRALQYANLLLTGELSPDSAVDASAVIETWMVPVDRSGRSASILAKMHTAAGKTEAASKVLEGIYSNALDREKLADAIDDLVSHPESGASPLLLSARLSLENGDPEGARVSIERAFERGDANGSKLMEVSRSLIAETGETSGDIAVRLASYLVENGDITDAVTSLYPMVDSDPAWVFGQAQKLITRDRSSAMVLSLLAAVLLETGKKEQAEAALEHLRSRRDRKSFREAVEVLDALDGQVHAFAELREARALFRYRSDRKVEAAADWFSLLLSGVNPSEEGRNLLTGAGIRVGTVAELKEADFNPSTPFQAFVAALICLREHQPEDADSYLLMSLDDRGLHQRIVSRLTELPLEILTRLDLKKLLPAAASGAPELVAGILERLRGTEDWKLALVTELDWGDPKEEALFRLRYLLSHGRVFLAGSSFREGSTDDPSIQAVARACGLVAEGRNSEALDLLAKPVSRGWTSALARQVLQALLDHLPEEQLQLRLLIAVSFETEKSFDQAAEVLKPVTGEPLVVSMLEEMHGRHPGETAIVRALTETYHSIGDFVNFQRNSSVLLDLDPAAAAVVVEMSTDFGKSDTPGAALIHAARVARKHSIDLDMDDVVTRAVLLEPDLVASGFGGEFGLLGPSAEALCSLASRQAGIFARLAREYPELKLDLTPELITIGMDSWDPAEDAEALMALAEHSFSSGFREEAGEILTGLSSRGGLPWSDMASERLLQEVESGDVRSTLFWGSARNPQIISGALQRLLPDGYDSLSGEERTVVASALLKSGQDIRNLLNLSGDESLFPPDDADLAMEIAEACMNAFPPEPNTEPLSADETDTLVKIFFRGGLTAKAASMVMEMGTDPSLAMLREELTKKRSGSTTSGLSRAKDMFNSGDFGGAIRELGALEESNPDAVDLMARAQWNLGLRAIAIRTWVAEYRETGGERPLRRLLWSLDQAGSTRERIALRRFMMDKYPGILGPLAGIRGDGTGLETISGLHACPNAKKVKNG